MQRGRERKFGSERKIKLLKGFVGWLLFVRMQSLKVFPEFFSSVSSFLITHFLTFLFTLKKIIVVCKATFNRSLQLFAMLILLFSLTSFPKKMLEFYF